MNRHKGYEKLSNSVSEDVDNSLLNPFEGLVWFSPIKRDGIGFIISLKKARRIHSKIVEHFGDEWTKIKTNKPKIWKFEHKHAIRDMTAEEFNDLDKNARPKRAKY